jgi:hypothetical protein
VYLTLAAGAAATYNEAMSDDQFAKLFKYMEDFRAGVDARFESVNRELHDIRSAVAESAAEVTDIRQEFLVLSHQFDGLRTQLLL